MSSEKKKPFTKPAKTFQQQCEILTGRGMELPNEKLAVDSLSHISYYRLAGYWLPFEESRDSHRFRPNTNFEAILNIYTFDRQLRLLMLDAIEHFEVSIRTQWANSISRKFGPHGYYEYPDASIKKQERLNRACQDLRKQISRSDEKFIRHYQDTYQEPFPPAWVAVEVMSFSLVSKFYSNLPASDVRREIASTYQFDQGFLEGFLEHICYVRNICAHHSRLWNRHLVKKMPLPRSKPPGLRDSIFIDPDNKTEHKIYNTIVVMQHLMQCICPGSSWAKRLLSLIDKYDVDIKRMGFPLQWKDLPLWRDAL